MGRLGRGQMKKLLYVDCCIRRESSRTRKLAEAFLDEIASGGAYQVERLTLMDEPLTPMTEGFFLQRETLLSEGKLSHARFRYARQFAEADAVVIAAPFWDLSFPALLKIYIENVCVQGITFDCNDTRGCYGVCRAKRLAFLTTRGGAYQNSKRENGAKYMEDMADFFGIGQFDAVAADGIDLVGEDGANILLEACERAKTLAKTF